MKIGNDTGISLGNSLVTEAMKQLQAADASATLSLESQTADTLVAQAQSPTNLMENNFVQADAESSRYTKGMMIGFQVKNAFQVKMTGIVETYKLMAGSTESYAERALIGKKAAEAVKDAVSGEVFDNETQRMENERAEDTAANNEGTVAATDTSGQQGRESGTTQASQATSEATAASRDLAAGSAPETVAAQQAASATSAQDGETASGEANGANTGVDVVV